MSEATETSKVSDLLESILSNDGTVDSSQPGGSSQGLFGKLASTTSPFISSIKSIINNINKIIDNEVNKKLSQKERSELKQLHLELLLECFKAEAIHLATEAKVVDLENQLTNKVTTLDNIEKDLQTLVNNNKENNKKKFEFLNTIGENESVISTKPGPKKDESPVLVIDTNENSTAFSYRDALMKMAPDLNIPTPADLVIPRANRIIVKMKDTNNLEKFRNIIENDPNLGKLAQSKISKQRKTRLIMFGVPDSVPELEFKSFVEALEETGGRPIELIKSFKNGKKIMDTSNYIIDVDSKTADNLLTLSKFVLNFNRIRIQRYFNILRCYRCQRFGHASHNCKWSIACAACA
ncbi:hypothetical protein JTE90_004041 [Oedothorax gibbosus]|uniref:CCHC-type domain-containing protein n=1 Tax=Oedothorax gibbosus TaxID=931172 RepID=A0AAV6U5U0_9ARAC|nr:hypothetical protein JTE90_004041 [Oedothorax gibbosus]